MNTDVVLILKLIADSGLMVLIWLVQLVIYPSFGFYESSRLKFWHKLYTRRITLVVLPLMLSQLILSCWLVAISNWDVLYASNAFLVLLTWASTFIIFVPLHSKIDRSNRELKTYIQKLISYNWIRTFLWTVIFLLTLVVLFL